MGYRSVWRVTRPSSFSALCSLLVWGQAKLYKRLVTCVYYPSLAHLFDPVYYRENMFKNTNASFLLVLLTVFATLAAATPTMLAPTGGGGSNSCGSTDIKCCQHVGTFSEVQGDTKVKLIPALIGLLGATVDVILGVVLGVTCSGVSVGGSCTATSVCCENVVFNGLINVGCVAIDVL